jgi:ubiquinone/menaquinone biosynthesis C-methylase UbiE
MAKDAFKFSGQAALDYDEYLGPILFEPYARELTSGLTGAQHITEVLEIACGTGRLTRHLYDRYKSSSRFVASDLNTDMLNVAKQKLSGTPIEFQVEDAQKLSFADNSFDLVICQFGLMFLQDKKQGLSEALRVLRPGGKFIFTTWDNTENMPVHKLIFNDLILPYYNNEDTGRLLVPFSLHNPLLLKNWMEDAGFKQVEVKQLEIESGSSSAREVVTAFFIKHSLGLEILSKDPVQFENIAAKMEDMLTHQFGRDNLKFMLSAFVVSGEKAS